MDRKHNFSVNEHDNYSITQLWYLHFQVLLIYVNGIRNFRISEYIRVELNLNATLCVYSLVAQG